MAEMQRAGGARAAKPKQIFDALQPHFPELGLVNVRWHLSAHRKREEREAEWLENNDGPVRWTGR